MPIKVNLPEIKIDCFTVKIRKFKDRKSDKDEFEFVGFDEFYNDSTDLLNKNNEFIDFFRAYINSFEGKFAVHNSGKAIFLNTSKVKFNSEKRTIRGIVEGGVTNMGGSIKEQDKPEDEDASFVLTPNHVETQPYYFLLYVPKNSNVGLLLFQSYSVKSVADIFKKHLQFFLSSKTNKLILDINSIIPKELAEDFKKKSTLNKIILRKYDLSSDRIQRLLGSQYKITNDVTVEIRISGVNFLTDEISKSFFGDNTKLFDVEEIHNLGFLDGEHEILMEYEHEGKKATIKSSKKFEFTPSFYVKETDIVRDDNLLPTFESLDSYCNSLLLSLLNQFSK